MDARWPYVPRSVELWRVKHEPEPDAGAWGGFGEAAAHSVLYAGHEDDDHMLDQIPLNNSHAGAVRQTFPHMLDESFERHVMNWFQHAGTRLKRH